MYNPKFNYSSLDRKEVNGSRRYVAPDGRYLPSVTTVLDATKPAERVKALNEWKQRMGKERAQQISTEAAARGTKMHTFLEHYVKNGSIPTKPPNPFQHPSWHMAEIVIQRGLAKCNEFWGTEVSLYYPSIYAGTTDCAGLHSGIESIIDFKQTNKPKKREWIDDYFLQLCAYAEAHNEIYDTNIRRGVVMMCVQPVVNAQGIITSVPEYQEFILEGDEYERYRCKWWNRLEQYYTMNPNL